VLAAFLLVLMAPAAVAVEGGEVAAVLREQGFYVEPGSEDVDRDALRAQFAPGTTDVRPVILAGTPSGGVLTFAEDVITRLGQDATVLVISPDQIRVVSTAATDDEVNGALDTAKGALDFETADAGEIALAFARAYPASAGAPTRTRPQDGGGGGVPIGVLLAGGALAVTGVVALGAQRWRRGRYRRSRRVMAEARAEVREQIDVLTGRIERLSGDVELAGPEASALFNEAAAAYDKAQEDVERTAAPQELERVSDELDHARWQLEAVEALLEGRDTPSRPEREPACFFDPTHGAGVVQATIDAPPAEREAPVCASCAGELQAGRAPQPRMIVVGGRQVPAPLAPRPYGGGGLDWLSDFSVILGGHRAPYGWGGYARPRRSPAAAGNGRSARGRTSSTTRTHG
jgi:hypothetical protein